jgi:S-adenosylmethionine hydrolase
MIEEFDVRMGAFVLASAAPYFPEGAINVAVVDPGVGTKRRALLVQTNSAFYIGPDNGILMLAAKKNQIRHAFVLSDPEFMLPRISATFHGRDVFAPAAAYLASGVNPEKFGPEIEDYVVPSFVQPELRAKDLASEILHIDNFGNVISNVSIDDLKKAGIKVGERLAIRHKSDCFYANVVKAYGDVERGSLLTLIGSHGFLEIAMNQDNASQKLRMKTSDALIIKTVRAIDGKQRRR